MNRMNETRNPDLFGLNLSTNNPNISYNEFNGLNNGFGGNMNSSGNRGSFISATSNNALSSNSNLVSKLF